jgi:hydrogenase maturation protease
MKPTLIIGLGSPVMGDEGVGYWVADALSHDPRLPVKTAVLLGGTDLLRLADKMEGYSKIILIDAVLDPQNPGRVEVFEDDFSALKDRQENAHQLSVVQAIELLRVASPTLQQTQFVLILVGIAGAKLKQRLSPELQERLREIVSEALEQVAVELFE